MARDSLDKRDSGTPVVPITPIALDAFLAMEVPQREWLVPGLLRERNADGRGQECLEAALTEQDEVIILDNVSTLFRTATRTRPRAGCRCNNGS